MAQLDDAIRDASIFYGSEISPESLERLLRVRYPELLEDQIRIIVGEALE